VLVQDGVRGWSLQGGQLVCSIPLRRMGDAESNGVQWPRVAWLSAQQRLVVATAGLQMFGLRSDPLHIVALSQRGLAGDLTGGALVE
jgi:hypothetical protein